jgi:RimJ/RimL family protein N-acetyltransferase
MDIVVPGRANTLSTDPDSSAALDQHQQKMLKMVAKGFYKELVNYGIKGSQVLTVAGHLLDNLIDQKTLPQNKKTEFYNRLFAIRDIQDEWSTAKRLSLQEVGLCPMPSALVPQVLAWLSGPNVRENFYPPFPQNAEKLMHYFQEPAREYFCIEHAGRPVGIIGAENIDGDSGKLEMKKLVGDPNLRGKGIGKRATFLFLYHVFTLRKFKKVYIHSLDVNMRNINLNAKFGFEVEGIFFEEVVIKDQRRDVVRMGLSAPVWWNLFSAAEKPVAVRQP